MEKKNLKVSEGKISKPNREELFIIEKSLGINSQKRKRIRRIPG